jgi:hypothetical protein
VREKATKIPARRVAPTYRREWAVVGRSSSTSSRLPRIVVFTARIIFHAL